MQFVNIVVHSVEDMNFRVHLQYEFTKLGLDDYLEKLRLTESEELQVCNTFFEIYEFLPGQWSRYTKAWTPTPQFLNL
jgi:hypothetical protein